MSVTTNGLTPLTFSTTGKSVADTIKTGTIWLPRAIMSGLRGHITEIEKNHSPINESVFIQRLNLLSESAKINEEVLMRAMLYLAVSRKNIENIEVVKLIFKQNKRFDYLIDDYIVVLYDNDLEGTNVSMAGFTWTPKLYRTYLTSLLGSAASQEVEGITYRHPLVLPDHTNPGPNFGWVYPTTLLGVAAYWGHIDLVRFLIDEKNADPNTRSIFAINPLGQVWCGITMTRPGRCSPELDILKSKYFQIVEKLLKHGANARTINILQKTYDDSSLPEETRCSREELSYKIEIMYDKEIKPFYERSEKAIFKAINWAFCQNNQTVVPPFKSIIFDYLYHPLLDPRVEYLTPVKRNKKTSVPKLSNTSNTDADESFIETEPNSMPDPFQESCLDRTASKLNNVTDCKKCGWICLCPVTCLAVEGILKWTFRMVEPNRFCGHKLLEKQKNDCVFPVHEGSSEGSSVTSYLKHAMVCEAAVSLPLLFSWAIVKCKRNKMLSIMSERLDRADKLKLTQTETEHMKRD